MSDDDLKEALSQARRLLRPAKPRRGPVWPALAAAAFYAISALSFAAAAILAPIAQQPHAETTNPRGIH